MLYWVCMLLTAKVQQLLPSQNETFIKTNRGRLFTSIGRRRRRSGATRARNQYCEMTFTSCHYITWYITSIGFPSSPYFSQLILTVTKTTVISRLDLYKKRLLVSFLYSIMDRKYLVFSSYVLVFWSFLAHQWNNYFLRSSPPPLVHFSIILNDDLDSLMLADVFRWSQKECSSR